MKHSKRRILSLFLAVCTLLGCLLPGITTVEAAENTFPNTYVNTGDQRKDIINVALSQVGYTEGPSNRTKYGAWYPAANQPWCATFVSWCVAQAEIPTDVIKQSAIADPGSAFFNIPMYDGINYTPKPGDFFFTRSMGHVGIVVSVDGDYFYTAEGNTNVHDPDDPNPPELEGLYVMSNRRKISKYIFGSPNYRGGDKEHTYVKGQDEAHPHAYYWYCTTCGDKHYTGGTAVVDTCGSCFPCGCSPASGYYMVDTPNDYCLLRSGHGSDYGYYGGALNGEVVKVLGRKAGSSWVWVEYNGKRGHVNTGYLTSHHGPAAAPALTSDHPEYVQQDTAKLSWNLPENTNTFFIRIYRNNALLVEKNLGAAQSYDLTDLAPGEYEVKLYATNESGISPEANLKFTVRDVYRVSFDTRGGSNGPEMQTQTLRQVMTLSTTVPTLAEHTFLGWTDSADSKFVTYKPGDSFIANNDVTLYAVWKQNAATLDNLTIDRLPAQTRYLKGDKLNTNGLSLKLLYSDGSGQLVTDSFTTAGFTSDTLGTKTVTVTYGDKTVSFDVQIMTYIPGDVNEDRLVDRDDVMQLLWHISFPEKFPIHVNADFKEDGKVNRDDVMQLLWHVAFPDKFSVPDANTHTHNWTAATCHEPKFCNTCGATEGSAAGHAWKDATCTDPKTCSTCGATEGSAVGHAWQNATCTDPKTCSTCGATEGSAAGHTWKDATCTDPKTCNTCGTTEGDPLGHDHVADPESGNLVCGRCGDTVTDNSTTTDPGGQTDSSTDTTPPGGTTSTSTDTTTSAEE